jgi:hypothetical protein
MPTKTATYAVTPIAPEVLAGLRVRDDAGRVPSLVVDHDGGSPLRCCLRASGPGETLLLASYAPLRRWAAGRGFDPGAYDEVGPVFVHPGGLCRARRTRVTPTTCAGHRECSGPTASPVPPLTGRSF